MKPPVYRRGCELPPSRDPLPNGCWSVARYAGVGIVTLFAALLLLGCATRDRIGYWADASNVVGHVTKAPR